MGSIPILSTVPIKVKGIVCISQWVCEYFSATLPFFVNNINGFVLIGSFLYDDEGRQFAWLVFLTDR